MSDQRWPDAETLRNMQLDAEAYRGCQGVLGRLGNHVRKLLSAVAERDAEIERLRKLVPADYSPGDVAYILLKENEAATVASAAIGLKEKNNA